MKFLLDLCVCVDDVVRQGVEPWRGVILTEGLLSGRESSLVQTFCESCDITHPSVHMSRRFVIQGCLTLRSLDSIAEVTGIKSLRPLFVVY